MTCGKNKDTREWRAYQVNFFLQHYDIYNVLSQGFGVATISGVLWNKEGFCCN